MWDEIWPLCKRYIDTVPDEIDEETVIENVKAETFGAVIVRDVDQKIILVFFVEHLEYLTFKAVNICLLGGRDLRKITKELWEMFCRLLKDGGYKRIECVANDVVSRYHRRLGFKHSLNILHKEL